MTEPGVFLGAFLALLAGFWVFAHSSTDAFRFPDRAVGSGFLHGVDASLRFAIYLRVVGAVLIVWLGCFYAGRFLMRTNPGWFVGVRSRVENHLSATLCAVGSTALVARIAADRLDGLGPVLLASAGVVTALGIAGVRRLGPDQPGLRWRRQLTAWLTTTPLLLLPWPLVQVGGLLAHVRDLRLLGAVALGAAVLAAACAFAVMHRARANSGPRSAVVRRAFSHGVAPLFAFPLLCPIANEIQYTLSARRVIDPRRVAFAFLGLLAVAATLSLWRALKGRTDVAPGRLLARFYFPIIVFGSALLTLHQQQVAGESISPLGEGEQIGAIYQLFAFHKWPFVDVWPAHGLFDYWGALYAWVNGFHPYELTVWNSVFAACAVTAAYAILAFASTPLFAFTVVMLLPLDAVFPLPRYSLFYAEPSLLVVGLTACWALHRPSVRRYAGLSLATFLCFFWNPASGVACIVAVFALLVVNLVTTPERGIGRRGLEVFALTGVGVLLGYVVLLASCHRPVLETFTLASGFIQADPMIGGRPTVLEQFDAKAFLQYVALPCLGILYLGKLARHAIERRPLGYVDSLLGFLALVSLVLFARTLSRHGLIEGFQGFYFPFLLMAALMPRSHASDTNRAAAQAWFCLVLMAYSVVFPVAAPKPLALRPFDFRSFKLNESRVTGKPPAHDALTSFMAASLRPDDTFVELCNEPLLYVMLKRELPASFFFPTMFYATDRIQNIYLERLEAFGGERRIPFVLLPGAGGWGNADQIPNTLRSYRIAEYVYRHYVPFGALDDFDIWVSRARWDEVGKAVKPLALTLAEPAGYAFSSVEPPRREEDALRLKTNGPDPRVDGVVRLDNVTLGGLSSYHGVRFRYRSNVAGTLEMFFRYAGGAYNAADAGRFSVRPNAEGSWQVGELPIPAQPKPGLALTGFRIDPPDGSELDIQSIELVYGEPLPGRAESFSASMLPFIWGNFDARLGSGGGTVLEQLALPKAEQPLDSFDLTLRPEPDKSTGNYLELCLRVKAAGGEGGHGSRRWQAVQHQGGWQTAGHATLSYGTEPASTIEFDLVRPDPSAPGMSAERVDSFERECKRYLIRLSAQHAWSRQNVTSMHIATSVPIVLEAASLLKGD